MKKQVALRSGEDLIGFIFDSLGEFRTSQLHEIYQLTVIT